MLQACTYALSMSHTTWLFSCVLGLESPAMIQTTSHYTHPLKPVSSRGTHIFFVPSISWHSVAMVQLCKATHLWSSVAFLPKAVGNRFPPYLLTSTAHIYTNTKPTLMLAPSLASVDSCAVAL